jgi:hypothetical protein
VRRVLFDHSAPAPLARFLPRFDVTLTEQMGWTRLHTGDLLSRAEEAGFDVLLSGDKSMKAEQNMRARKIALLYMSDNHWPIVKNHVTAIIQALEEITLGEIRQVFCGRFVARKFRTHR